MQAYQSAKASSAKCLRTAPCVPTQLARASLPARAAPLRPSNRLPAPPTAAQARSQPSSVSAAPTPAPSSSYSLTIIWKRNSLGVSLDQVLRNGSRVPLTPYFYWPQSDAWEDLKAELEKPQRFTHRDRVSILNNLTRIINYWQSEEFVPSLKEAKKLFPDTIFIE